MIKKSNGNSTKGPQAVCTDTLSGSRFLFCLFMSGMLTAESAVFAELQLIRRGPFVFCGVIISLFALCADKGNIDSHGNSPWVSIGLYR